MSTVNSKNINIEVLRIIGCISVVLIHTVGYNITTSFIGDITFQLILLSFFKVFIPIFILITGYTFNKNVNIKKLWIKNIYRIIIPIIIVSILLEIFSPFFEGKMSLLENLKSLNFSFNTLYKIFISTPVIESRSYHLWYLYELLVLYLLYPLLKVIVKKKNILKFLIILLFITEIIFPSIYNIFKIKFLSIFSVNIGYFLLYFLIGYLFKENIKNIRINKFYFLLIYFFMIGLSIICYNYIEKENCSNLIYAYSFSYNFIFIFLAAISFFMFFMKLSLKKNNFVLKVSNLTLKIYYLHIIFLNLVLRYNVLQSYFSKRPILFLLLTTIIVFSLTLISSYILDIIINMAKKVYRKLKRCLYEWNITNR